MKKFIILFTYIILTIAYFIFLNNYSLGNTQEFSIYKPINYELATTIIEKIYGTKLVSDFPVKMVTVCYDGNVQTHMTNASTYAEFIKDLDISLKQDEELKITCTSSPDILYDNTYMLIEIYSSTYEDIIKEIPYEITIEGEPLCAKLDTKEVTQAGKNGLLSQRIKKTYKNGDFILEEIIDEQIISEPVNEIITYTNADTPNSVEQIGYNCDYWNNYIDTIDATDEEKQWLKFTMKWESGCNAEHNESRYKGLFQWSPCLWYELYPNDNIFDGKAQVKNTLAKLRAGVDPENFWPAVYKKYVATYGELSWLQ